MPARVATSSRRSPRTLRSSCGVIPTPSGRTSSRLGGADDGIVQWSWTFHPQGRGTVVEQSWRLLRLDPVLGRTRGDLDALRDYRTNSVEATLISLARWIAEE
ncbi:hypothetical protein ACIPY6_40470 [Streptomyces sp. NPDC090054]|uniref:hypothetical protein n=1 Tax=Streptomyces sp. NPDC090054 TaxID=3365933 RepID=UPI0038280C3D